MTKHQQAIVNAYVKKQSLRLVAIDFGISKSTVHKAIVRTGRMDILRQPYVTYNWERPKRRSRGKNTDENLARSS